MDSKVVMAGFILLSIVLLGCTGKQETAGIAIPDSQVTSVEGIDSITTENYANTKLDYYYYVPLSIVSLKPTERQKSYPLLLIIPPLSGRGEQAVTTEFKKFAEEEKFVIISPSFTYDEQNWAAQESYQYPSVWSGNALIEIVDRVEQNTTLKFKKYYLFGFSAGAQFSLRFCIWKPELCTAVAAHGSGGTVMPDKNIDTRFFVTVGKQDTERIEKSKEFYNAAKAYAIDVTYREYDTGHSLTKQQIEDSLQFFKGTE